MMLSILAGHNRFCNMEQIYGDTVSAQVLKLKRKFTVMTQLVAVLKEWMKKQH